MEVEKIIKERLECFNTAIEQSAILKIAGHFCKGEEIPIGDGKQPPTITAEEECFKVINHNLKSAVLVSVDSIITTPENDMHHVIESLETGITTKLHGVTRIVG